MRVVPCSCAECDGSGRDRATHGVHTDAPCEACRGLGYVLLSEPSPGVFVGADGHEVDCVDLAAELLPPVPSCAWCGALDDVCVCGGVIDLDRPVA